MIFDDLNDLASIWVVIPALNEEATIGSVIQALHAQQLFNICVVDNGGCDRTPQIAHDAGATVVTEPQKGYGQACWRGVQTIGSKADWILFCDADGSDDLQQLPTFLSQRHDYDLILGNRRGTLVGRQQLTPVQNFGNGLATRLIHWGWGYCYHDLGPLRLIRKTALDQINLQDRGYGWTVEMQARAVECNLRIRELPVNYSPRKGGQSKISGTLSGSFKAGTIILATLAWLYGQRLSQPFLSPLGQWGLVILSTCSLVMGSLWIRPQGDFLNQPEAVPIFWQGIAMMSVGFTAAWGIQRMTGVWFWGGTLATRLLLLGMYPGDDIWRYLWEGYIQTLGFSPYDLAPNADILNAFRPDWWEHINNETISAIYPPITQLGFRALATLSLSVLSFKLAFVAADVGICWFLSSRFGHRATIFYAWNPLVIYSFAGGGHYDSWFLLPLVAAWLWFEQPQPQPMVKRYLGSALWVGISVAIKWISLPILLFLALQGGRQRNLWLAVGVLGLGCLPMILTALPFCSLESCPLIPVESSFVSQGRSAEFMPYLVSLYWPTSRWINWPYLLPLGLWTGWLTLRTNRFQEFTERYLFGLLLLSPVIHAWYFVWLTPFAVASRHLGTRLVSLSAFVYFVLPHRLATGHSEWLLSDIQRAAMWIPFLAGIILSVGTVTQKPNQQNSVLDESVKI